MKVKNYSFNSLLVMSSALLASLFSTENTLQAQTDVWAAKASLTTGRRDAVGFAIGAKGYVGTGGANTGNLNDFWEYDPATNAWTQKANFAGGTRSGAMGFGIGTKGYLGGGYDNTSGAYITDFYEYDPTGNTWTAKATLPGIGGEEAVSFNIGAKGYYGTGFNGNVPPYCTASFYEYDPSANTWTTKASFPGTRYGSIGFGIGTKGYVGSGSNCVSGDVNSFYEFDPTANTWTAKANYPGAVRESATGFSIGSRGYVVNGRNSSTEYNDFYEYDPATNVWTLRATPLGGARLSSVGFGIGSKGYLVAGYDFINHSGSASFLNDVYEYSACPVNNQAVTPATSSAVCSGIANVTVASQAGVNYYLRNSGNAILSGPVVGTGSNITLPAGNITSTSTLNVLGKAASGGLTFDGVNDYVYVPYAAQFNYGTSTDFTYEAMIKCTASQGAYTGIITKAASGSPFVQLVFYNNRLAAEVFSSAGAVGVGNGLIGTTVLNDGQWHHVAMAVTRATNNAKLYVDGVVEADVTNIGIGGNITESGGTYIGAERNLNVFFNGSIDEVRIWNTARSVSQLTTNSTACLTGTETGLLAYYKFENGTGSTVTDIAGGNDNGTLTNMNTATAWTYGVENCAGCAYQLATQPVISINALTNRTLTAGTSSFCVSGSTTITANGSETGVNYYLKDNATGSVVTGPIAGTGSALNFTTGTITSTKVYNVTAKKLSTALTFDGVDDFVKLANQSSFDVANLTVETWIYSANYTQPGTIFEKGTLNSQYSLLFDNSTGFYFRTYDSGGGAHNQLVSIATLGLVNSNWYHIAATFDGTTKNIYVNGVLKASVTDPHTLRTGQTGAVIGSSANGGSYYFNGKMDELRIWSNAQTQAQIQANMNACLTGSESGLVAYYKFEDGNTALTDYAGGDNNGTLDNINISTAWTTSGVDNCGCTLQMANTPTVTINALPTVSVTSATICSGNTAVITPTGASTYTITGGTFTVSPATTASYSVTGTSSAGCVSSNTAVSTVSVNATPTITVNNPAICSGNSAVITPGGASTYSIGGGSFTVSPSSSATYSVAGTSTNGCVSASVTASVAVNVTPTLSVISPTICAGSSVVITPGGNTGGTYTITGGTFTVNPTVNTSYSVTGTSSLGCAATNTAVATVTAAALPTLSVNSATICSGNTAVITPSGAASYTITGGAYTVTPSSTSSYSITGTSAAGCAASNTITSTVSVNITPTLSVNSATICSGASVIITPTGAATYSISGGNFTVSPGSNSSYSVTGTAANGCLAANAAVSSVSVNTTPTLSVNSATICSGASVVIAPAGASTYSITGGNFTVSPNTTSSYTVSGTAANGCLAGNTAVSSVSVNTTPTLSVNSATICSGASVVIAPTGAASYTISGGNYTVAPNSTASYTVSGTAANGCVAGNAVATVSVNATPTLAVNNATICSGASAVITPTGGSTYSITGGNFTVTPNNTASYSVTGTAANGCVSGNAVSTVSVNATPTLAINGGAICPGNVYTLTPTGATGGTYTISGGSYTVQPSGTTSYTLTGIGANGCAAGNTAVATVTVVNTLTVAVAGATNVCSGKTTTLTATGASTYSWTTGATTNTIALSPAINTTYTVYGASGSCSNTAVVTVSVLLTPTVSATSATICSGSSATIIPGGNAGGTYTITGGNYTVTPGSTTSYSVTGTAANGCISSNTAIATISVNATPTLSVNSGSVCSGSTFAIVPTGANTYTISGGSYTVSPSANSSYSVTGTGTNGCVSATSAIASITVNALPTISLNSGAICPGNAFTFTPAGAATYTYLNGSGVVSPAVTTSYSVAGTSAQGCASSNTAVATVSVVNTLSISVSGATTICAGETTTLTASGASTYSWSNGSAGGSVSLSPSANTAYTVYGSSGSCSNTATFSVTVNTLPTITVNSGTICSGTIFTFNPTGAVTYSYSGGTATVNPTSGTSYSITGTDANGCVSNAVTSTVSVNALPAVTVTTSTGIICLGQTASLTAGGAVTYSWSTLQTSLMITVVPTATGTTVYTVTGTDANGCASTATIAQLTDECTGLVKNKTANDFGIYPNPNSGEFVVKAEEGTTIIIMTSLGQVVYTGQATAIETGISIRHLDNGVYFIKAVRNKDQQTVKLIKE